MSINDSEPNDTPSQANIFNLGDTIVGSLSSKSDVDFYKVTLTSAGVIKLDVSVTQLSNWAYTVGVYDSSGTALAVNFFGYVPSGSFSVGAAAGTYYVEVSTNNIYSGSPYTITTSLGTGSASDYEKEFNDTQATATPVSLDHVITGQRLASNDIDYYAVTADSAGTLTLDFQAPKKYSLSDYQLSIYDASGKLIDARTGNGNMTLVEQLAASGKYYVRVEQVKDAGYQGGDYKFVAHVDSSSQLASATALTSGAAVNGSIASASQHNWYKATLTAGSAYEFSVAGSASGGGTLSAPSLTLCAADGHALQYCTNLPTYSSGSTVYVADPQLAFVAPYSGTYYLMVDGLGTAGSYTLQQKADTVSGMLQDLLYPTTSGSGYYHWGTGATGSGASVTYGFMTTSSFATNDRETGFVAMTDSQKQTVRDVLALYRAFANITFTEVSDPNSADIVYGTSNQSTVSSGVTYYYGSSSTGVLRQSDVYINNTARDGRLADSDNMTPGQYGYETLIHETGHALGLKHPGNYNAGASDGTPPYISAAWDNTEYSIMSYLRNAEYEVSAQTPALLDIAAIQYLYGANSSSSAQTISFGTSGEFKQSALAGGGAVTLDFSNQTTDNIISAAPGTFSSIGLKSDGTHAHDNVALPFGAKIATVIGGSGNDYILGGNAGMLYGGAGDDTFVGCASKAAINGGAGTDKLELAAASTAEHVVKLRGNTVAVADTSGDVVLCRDVEQIRFADQTLDTSSLSVHDSLDLALMQIYIAAFKRAPESSGYNYWVSEEKTRGLTGVADVIFSLDVVKAIYPTSMSASDFVTAIYQNVFNRAPDTDGLNYWIQQLNAKSRGQLVIDMTSAALGTADGTSGKDYFEDRVDWALYAMSYQLDKATELTPTHLATLTTGVTADAATVISLIGQAESGVAI